MQPNKLTMYESSSIQLSKTALLNNLKFIKKRLKKDVTLCSVVKGNAYGHGLKEFVNIAHQLGIYYFGVHSADEAYYLKTVVQLPYNLFIMGNIANQAIEWAIENNVEFVVFDLEQLNEVIHICEKLNKTAKIHIEIETGMRRTGFEPEQLSQVFSILLKKKTLIELIGVFTHFAGAESLANQFRIQAQIKVFKLAVAAFKSKKLTPKYVHAACSAAMLNYPETQFDMVRIGILQYGFWPNSETHIKFCGEKESNPDLLKRVIKWTSKVMALKEVKKGHFVGYGTSYLAHKNMCLAIVPVGYSHGYNRNLSNIGHVLIHGKLCPVVGTINMNSLTVDVTSLKNVKKHDEVVLIGKQSNKSISVNSFSEQTQQLNYELLTRLPHHIPRIITT